MYWIVWLIISVGVDIKTRILKQNGRTKGVSYLELWAQSTTEDYIRAENERKKGRKKTSVCPVKWHTLACCQWIRVGPIALRKKWWWLFLHMQGFGGKVPGIILRSRCLFVCLFSVCKWKHLLAHTNFTPYSGISPQWLRQLRRLWTCVAWGVAYESISLIDSHIMPGQHS